MAFDMADIHSAKTDSNLLILGLTEHHTQVSLPLTLNPVLSCHFFPCPSSPPSLFSLSQTERTANPTRIRQKASMPCSACHSRPQSSFRDSKNVSLPRSLACSLPPSFSRSLSIRNDYDARDTHPCARKTTLTPSTSVASSVGPKTFWGSIGRARSVSPQRSFRFLSPPSPLPPSLCDCPLPTSHLSFCLCP